MGDKDKIRMNDLYLKVDRIAGESKDANHLGWINIKSYNWGAWRHAGSIGQASYRNLTIQTNIDKSTPALLSFTSNGNNIRKVELSACKAGGGQIEYYRITLENVIVVEVNFSEKSAGTEIEYEFQADIVKLQYWERNAAGGQGAETRCGWNLKDSASCF